MSIGTVATHEVRARAAGSRVGLRARPDRLVWVVLAAYALYAGLFILRTSFVIGGERYFVLFDDEMVSMRYARNLTHGYGLVWNPAGERVEGYTNLLWVLYMAVVHLLPVPMAKISVLVQATGALLLTANLLVVKRLASVVGGGSTFASLAAVLLVAFYLPLNTWGLQGTEVSALVLLVDLATYLGLRQLGSRRLSVWPYVLMGVATLVRLDMVVPFGILSVFLVWADTSGRRWTHLVAATLALVLCVGGQTLFRWWYYGDLLPNTYYLKMEGIAPWLRVSRGLYVLGRFVEHFSPVLLCLPIVLLIRRPPKPLSLLFLVFAGQVGYSVYVGGDAWEWWNGSNRFISVGMPALLVLLAVSIERVARWICAWRGRAAYLAGPVQLAGLAGALVWMNANSGTQPVREWLLLDRGLNVQGNAKYTELGLALRELTTSSASVAVVWAGSTPYFSERTAVDLLGRSDRRIAREAVRPEVLLNQDPAMAYYPGHSKWDLAYSIGDLRPDVVVGWQDTIPEAMFTPSGDYLPSRVVNHPLYLRLDSPNIRWERLASSL